MSEFLQDIRYGLRMLAKSRGFTAAAVLSLALGIGANTAVFSVVNAALLRTLPFHNPETLVLVWGEDRAQGNHRGQVSATDVADFRARNHVFEDISTYSDFGSVLTGAGEPERIPGAQVGDGFFSVMGAQPLLGRVFNAEEQIDGNDFVVVLSYGLWQKKFAGDPDIVGKTITLSARPYTVIGVMPADFQSLPQGLLTRRAEFYRPVAEPPDEKERSARHLRAIARLKPGATLANAQTEMSLIAQQLTAEHPADNANAGVHLVSLREDLVSPIRPALLMLFGAVGFLLLIACANVGNLLLARSVARYREVAIRAALGAGRGRLVRQFLTESILLALFGGTLGLIGAIWGAGLIQGVANRVMPMIGTIELDTRVLVFTFTISLATGVIFGCAPALRVSRADLNETLNDGGRTPGAVSTRSPLRSSLVIVEVALAMMLLISAGLLIKSMSRLQEVNPGFNPARILTTILSLPRAKYSKPHEIAEFYDRLLLRLRDLSGVESAAVTSVLPVSGNFDRRTIEIEGQPHAPAEQPDVDNYFVSPDYLATMSTPLRRGRALSLADNADAPLTVLVSETTARKLWPNEEAIGKRLRFYSSDPAGQNPWRTVVGVVADVKQYGLDQPNTMALYVPFAQFPNSSVTLVVRTRAEPTAMLSTVRREIQAVDSEQAVSNLTTMPQIVSDSIALRRFTMILLGIFAGLALILAAIGIYGVLAQSVAQRTHEIGIRMALGAQTRDVLKLIVGHGMALTMTGIAAGLAGAFGLTRLIANLLFGVGANDPGTFVAISLILGAVAFCACYLPARRASKLNPVVALSRT